MNFKNIDKKYRPVPFWSWNEKLNVPETLRQVGLMDDVGIGGFFMHARAVCRPSTWARSGSRT